MKRPAFAFSGGMKAATVVVFLCLLAFLAHSTRADQFAPQRMTVSGKPADIGSAIGQKYAGELRILHPILVLVGKQYTGVSKAEFYAKAAGLAQHIHEDDIAEMKGLAQASGLTYEDVLYLNVFYNLTTDQVACRQLVLWGDHTADGELLHARNLDWRDYRGDPLKRNNLILNVKPEGGIEYLMLTWPGLTGVLTGTNHEGITVAFNTLSGGWQPRAAEPIFFTLKRVLRSCKTLDEAIVTIRDAKPLGNGSIMISSAKEKRAAVVEVFDGQVGERESKDGVIGNTNTGTKETGVTGPELGPAETPACAIAREHGTKFKPESLRSVLADPKVLATNNIVSVIFNSAANEMLLSCGQNEAAKGEFHKYTLFEK